eukprot:1180015-Prorocentrum_minimum.AAC.2
MVDIKGYNMDAITLGATWWTLRAFLPPEEHHPDVGIYEEHEDEQRSDAPERREREHDGGHQALRNV